MKHTTTHQRNAFTLAELVMYMGILSILLVLFISLFGLLMDRQLETENESGLQQDAHYLLSRFSHEFGRASDILIPLQLGTPSAVLELNIGSVGTRYYLDGGDLLASSSGNIIQLNSAQTNISNLSARRLGVGDRYDVIQLSFDIVSRVKTLSGYDVIHFSTTLGIREK